MYVCKLIKIDLFKKRKKHRDCERNEHDKVAPSSGSLTLVQFQLGKSPCAKVKQNPAAALLAWQFWKC